MTCPVVRALDPQPPASLTIHNLVEIPQWCGVVALDCRFVYRSRVGCRRRAGHLEQHVLTSRSHIPEPAEVIKSCVAPSRLIAGVPCSVKPALDGEERQL